MKCPRCNAQLDNLIKDYSQDKQELRIVYLCSQCTSWITEFEQEGKYYVSWQDIRGKGETQLRNS